MTTDLPTRLIANHQHGIFYGVKLRGIRFIAHKVDDVRHALAQPNFEPIFVTMKRQQALLGTAHLHGSNREHVRRKIIRQS